MANQKVFVSPGVYTSETDLSFVSQSIGVTTLGMVGETIKGPAFEPIFITSYDEFQTFFGGTSPEKYINTQIPKYESAYIAKSYLQQSNQLYVTRILGLSGYDAGSSWSITTIANVNNSTIGLTGTTGVGSAISISFTGTTGTTGTFVITSADYPYGINGTAFSSDTYTNSIGAVSTFYDDLKAFANNVAESNTLTGQTSTYGSLPVSVYNTIIGSAQSGLTTYNYFGTTVALNSNGTPVDENDVWNYATFTNTSDDVYEGYSFYYRTSAWNQVGDTFTGTVTGRTYVFSGTAYTDYNNMVVATIRSRGITSYSSTNHGQIYSLTGETSLKIDEPNSTTISDTPFGNFVLSGNTTNNSNFTFNVSLRPTNSNYLTNVLGTDNFGKDRNDVPIFVEEHYPNLLNQAYKLGYIRGLKNELVYLPSARSGINTSIGWYLEKYQSPKTPFVVSELRGNKVYNLFKFISISDGSNANTEVKISIINMSFKNRTFDVLVRSYYDSDTAPIVLEKYTNCTLDETQNSFIAKKIGTSDGKYNLISKYIMLEMGDEFPSDAIPCGFMGYPHRKYGTNLSPNVLYKTKYYFNNEVVYNEPFASSNAVPGDNLKRTYLGFSTSYGYDNSLLSYKGKQNPNSIIADGLEWNVITKGFHMDSGATVVNIANAYTTSGQTAFEVGTGSFNTEPEDNTSPYYYLYSRKFTLLFEGGFDGWDVYSEKRTNGDSYQIGGTDYMRGALSIPGKYAAATGQGTFKEITEGDGTIDFATTDYYAYLKGILTFQNPESTNINVFVTPGIDYVNNSNLVENAIDMVESDRADSIYIVTTPDANLLTTNVNDVIYPQESIVSLEETNIDSNYTATYYPWILVRDQVNNTQVYIPPTAEVCRNLALTDNVAFPWFASAGYNRGLVNSVKARLKLTQDDRDTLYQGRINPIATFSDVNTVIWGNKTLQVRESALNRLNVRRLLLQARKLISAVAVRLLFEQNDQIVRQQFLDTVNPILDGIRRDRGLTDFRVTVSSDPEDIDRNTMSGKIYIKPTRSLEFISLEFVITPTGASFEDI